MSTSRGFPSWILVCLGAEEGREITLLVCVQRKVLELTRVLKTGLSGLLIPPSILANVIRNAPLDSRPFFHLFSTSSPLFLPHHFFPSSPMKATLSGNSPLCVPLILDEKPNGLAHKLEEVESNCHPSSTTNVSFFKTCFNGLNALSGST